MLKIETDEQAWELHKFSARHKLSTNVVMEIAQWGYRMGQRDMRERAAKECDAADERAYPFACAAMIRALPIEDANG